MSFHLDYLLALAGVRVETCTQVEGKIFLGLSILSEGIVCHHCKNHTEKLHQNRPILVRDLSVFGRPVYLKREHLSYEISKNTQAKARLR